MCTEPRTTDFPKTFSLIFYALLCFSDNVATVRKRLFYGQIVLQKLFLGIVHSAALF